MTDDITAAAPLKSAENTSREELISSIGHLLAGHSFALIHGGHHEEVASKIVDRIIACLATKPSDAGVRERIITTCANIANRYRPNSTARDIEREIRALHQSPNTGDVK